jgi:hypothetical protein
MSAKSACLRSEISEWDSPAKLAEYGEAMNGCTAQQQAYTRRYATVKGVAISRKDMTRKKYKRGVVREYGVKAGEECFFVVGR